MSVVSITYLLFAAFSSVGTWIFHHKTRKYWIAILNVAFLYLLGPTKKDLLYLACLVLFTTVFGALLRNKNKALLTISVLVPILGLAFFKYGSYWSENILMPIGLSFYTFKALSYLIDVYQDRLAYQGLVCVWDYITFFPSFMAGPIHRSKPFFDELNKDFVFTYKDQKNGFVLLMLGMFEKLVIAQQLSSLQERFASTEYTGYITILSVILYSFVIYTDFDSYSNIAIGTARLMGFHLERNFYAPYLSASLKEFWKRWHISLSSWLKDYVYIPLGGSRKGTVRTYLNTLIVFVASGLWHGNTILFLIWGIGHGVLSVIESLITKPFQNKPMSKLFKPFFVLLNFFIVTILWVFFSGTSLTQVTDVFHRMFIPYTGSFNDTLTALSVTQNEWVWMWILLAMVFISDLCRNHTDMITWLSNRNFVLRWSFYIVLIVIAIIFGVYGPGYHAEDFIYVTF